MAVNLVVLCLPLGGIAVLRIYESALVRQTESELIAQAAFIASTYRASFARVTAEFGEWTGTLDTYGRSIETALIAQNNPAAPGPAAAISYQHRAGRPASVRGRPGANAHIARCASDYAGRYSGH